MKKFFAILIALFFILPYVVQAQPWSSGMNGVLVPDDYVIAQNNFSASGKMLMPRQCGYSFDDVMVEHYEREAGYVDPASGYAMFHMYCSPDINVSVYAPKINSTSAVSIFQLYSSRNSEDPYWRAREIIRDHLHISSEVITDTVTGGFVYIGTGDNPKDRRAIITGGEIIISFNTKTCILSVATHNLRVKESEDAQESEFVFPDIKL